MNVLRMILIVGATWMVAGCASYQAVPDDYTGPTATLVDSAYQDVGNKARIFAVTAIDGNPVHNAFSDSGNKSSGKGFLLTIEFTPEPDKRYAVRGQLGPEESSVWLIDERTLEVVTEPIVARKD